MGVLDILDQWVSPITDPLNDFLKETQMLAQIHQDSVSTFNSLAQDLTDTNAADAFTGDGANSFVEMTGDYLISETELSGNALGLAGPLAEAGTTCTTMVTSIGEGVTVATEAGPAVDALVDVTTVVDVTTIAQGGLDVPEDVVAGASTALVILTVIEILAALALVIYTAWLIWQNSMNSIANSPMPKLPKTPQMSNTPGTSGTPQKPGQQPLLSGLTPAQQHDLETLVAEFPDANPDDIKGLLLAGFTADEIRRLLRGGFTHAQIQSIITRIRQAQQDQNGKDKLGLTAEQIRELALNVADACSSPDKNKQLEGQVARALMSDLVSFNRKVYDKNGVEVGEIDIETSNAIIEVTNTPQSKLDQLLKERDNTLINPNHKQVILYAPGYSHAADQQFAAHGFPIIRSMKDLFSYLRGLH